MRWVKIAAKPSAPSGSTARSVADADIAASDVRVKRLIGVVDMPAL
jgi:hypothetical protein